MVATVLGDCSRIINLELDSGSLIPPSIPKSVWNDCCSPQSGCNQTGDLWCMGSTYVCTCTIVDEDCAEDFIQHLTDGNSSVIARSRLGGFSATLEPPIAENVTGYVWNLYGTR
eukprot:TRINITY_DN17648_c0_g1_i2.p1 TRINITY_DN17648_c0_g1~~TRINITY_DN17648_c0_g1_i2.p1  ORF type:complete len:131 (-),score=6.65 TRINITY_DN17648_c0_g1_i2:107-448(-)